MPIKEQICQIESIPLKSLSRCLATFMNEKHASFTYAPFTPI